MMAPDLMLALLMLAISASSLKYVYVNDSLSWKDAQSHCQEEYTDLAPVSSKFDMQLVQRAVRKSLDNKEKIWFGLMRNTSDTNKWMWSGGTEVTTEFWDDGEPGSWQMYGILFNYKWHAAFIYQRKINFLCYKVHAMREKKTWEEALEFCREMHLDLASVASETEMMLMTKELQKQQTTTEHVWVGLRFLAGEWLWVDGQPFDYAAWGPNEQTQCPAVRCGALRVTGTCDDKGDNVFYLGEVKEWNVRNCTERLHFLCY